MFDSILPGYPVLSLLVFLPLVGAALLCLPFAGGSGETVHGETARFFDAEAIPRSIALTISLATFLVSLLVAAGFNPGNGEYQFVESVPWIDRFGVRYVLGVDGISLCLVLLTTLLVPLVVLASPSVSRWPRGYLASMLILETAMLGTVLALDLLLFYVFWELMLAPMYFIIGIWGGARRLYATVKFVLYTVAGSVLMLAAILYLAYQYKNQSGAFSFYLPDLLSFARLSVAQEMWLFAAFALAFAIKVPLFPLHTWLPDAHVEAPTGGSVILAGVLLKMGVYGFIRFAWPLFPRAAEIFTPALVILAVTGILYGALVAAAQADIKKLVAYSSVSHLGYCMLGLCALNSVATSGAVLQMLNHGVSTGALFLLVGVLYERRHTREIAEYGGLASRVPLFSALFLVFTLSSIALPLTNGFVGEFMILTGSFKEFPVATAFSVIGVILGAWYMLTLYQRCSFGPIDTAKNGALLDVNKREILTFAPLLILVFAMGIYPALFLRPIEVSVTKTITTVKDRAAWLTENEEDESLGDSAMASPRPEIFGGPEGGGPNY